MLSVEWDEKMTLVRFLTHSVGVGCSGAVTRNPSKPLLVSIGTYGRGTGCVITPIREFSQTFGPHRK